MSSSSPNVQRLRALVQDCISNHLHTAASFYADKLATLTNGAPVDVFLLAQVGICWPPLSSARPLASFVADQQSPSL